MKYIVIVIIYIKIMGFKRNITLIVVALTMTFVMWMAPETISA